MKFDPCRILKKHDSGNAFEVELIEDMDISPIFNILDIFEYHELDEEIEDKPIYPKKKIEGIVKILDTRTSKSTRGKDYKEYLVQW